MTLTTHSLRLGSLPLFWKVLAPFLTLMVLVGTSGVFLIVHDLSSRTQAALDQDLSRRSVDARAFLRERELYLLEAANFAANIEGMEGAMQARDQAATGRLLQSVLALKADLTLVSAAGRDGSGLVEFSRAASSEPAKLGTGTPWADHPFVVRALNSRDGGKSAGLLTSGGRTLLAIAAPVCNVHEECTPEGVTIVGVAMDELAASATGKPAKGMSVPTGIAIYDVHRDVLARTGEVAATERIAKKVGDTPVRGTSRVGSTEIAILYAPFEVQGTRLGTVAVSVPTATAFATVRRAGIRLASIVLVAMAGIVAIGALLSRSINAQVRPLLDTNRALGRGDLSARAPVLAEDELGELARGVNQMAEQLQASYAHLELRVDQRTEEVRRLLRERTEFFAGLSHELRTPLAVILAQAKMLVANPGDTSASSEAGETIQVSAAQLLGVVNDILDLARAEAGSLPLTLASVRLDEFIEELEPMLTRLGTAAGVRVDVAPVVELPAVLVDRNKLREVVVNLVDNAIKYTPSGGNVELRATAGPEHARVVVSDTGVGIPPEVGEKVFEPFYLVVGTQPQRDQPASGLGLALARRWVEALGGTIGWTARPGGGTEFAFTVPVDPTPPPQVRVHRGRARDRTRSMRHT